MERNGWMRQAEEEVVVGRYVRIHYSQRNPLDNKNVQRDKIIMNMGRNIRRASALNASRSFSGVFLVLTSMANN